MQSYPSLPQWPPPMFLTVANQHRTHLLLSMYVVNHKSTFIILNVHLGSFNLAGRLTVQ